MNIKDFLIENYPYILIVIVLIIITIIGFLADKKKGNGKGKENMNNTVPNGNVPSEPAMQQANYQSMGGIIPNNQMVNPTPNQMGVQPVSPVNNGMVMNNNLNMPPQASTPSMEVPNQNFNNAGMQTMPQPVEPINRVAEVTPEPMYQPMPEQTPVMAPQVSNMNYQQPVPVEPLQNVQAPVNNFNSPNTGIAYNAPEMPANNVVPQAVEAPMPIPTPNNVPPVQMPLPGNVAPQPTPMPNQPVNPAPQQAGQGTISFVYGPQQQTQNTNNTGYMQ